MEKCNYINCDNIFVIRKNKQYCCRTCKNRQKNIRNTKNENQISNPISKEIFNNFKTNKIDISISYRNITHYRKLGYNPVLNKNLEILIKDLPTSSHVKLPTICSICGTENNLLYYKYIENVKRCGFYSCKKCSIGKKNIKRIENGGGIYINKNDNILKKSLSCINNDIITYSEDLYDDCHINDSYLLYRNECRRITNSNVKKLISDWNGIDYYTKEDISNNFNLPHNDPDYPTIDHKDSIYFGFVNNIKPDEIGSINNLCVTKRSINSTKRDLCELDFLEKFINI